MSNQRETVVSVPLNSVGSDIYWRRILEKHDLDIDGKISYVELRSIILSRSYDHELPENVVDQIMVLADRDSSGYLDFDEFITLIHDPNLRSIFGHFIDRYVKSIIPQANSIIAKSSWTGFQPWPVTKGDTAYRKEYRCWPPAICMIMISIAEMGLFCYDISYGEITEESPITKMFAYIPVHRQEAWRFLTYMLVHVRGNHLLFNLLMQLLLGVPLEMVHRGHRVVTVYLAGVAAGSLATSIASPTESIAGASGGIYAFITAHVATIIMNWAQIKFPQIQLAVILLLVSLDTGPTVYYRYWLNMQDNIGIVSHLGGAGAGLLVGIGVLRNLEKKKWKKRLCWTALILYFSLMTAGVLAHIFWTSHFPIYEGENEKEHINRYIAANSS